MGRLNGDRSGFVLGAVALLAIAFALNLGLATHHPAPAAAQSQGTPAGECDPRQPTYSGQLTVDGQQRFAYRFCAWGEHMYVADTFADGEAGAVVVNGSRICRDGDGANNGVTHCNWELGEGAYMDICLFWAGACRAWEWATASGFCIPRPRVDSLRMQAHAVGGKGNTRRYGPHTRVSGWLRAPDGTPVAGANLCISTRMDLANAPFRDDDHVTTDERGRFSYLLPPGPSRRVYFVHRVPGGAVADSAFVRVRAPVKLHVSERSLLNGQVLTLGGKLRAGPFPRGRGVLVELQADRGSRWQTFGTTRANAKGRYRFNYQFTRTTGTQRYSLRARVPAQSGYPFADGASRPVHVRVTG